MAETKLSYDEVMDILESEGWTVECESPLELRHADGSFASGAAAEIVLGTILEYCAPPDQESDEAYEGWSKAWKIKGFQNSIENAATALEFLAEQIKPNRNTQAFHPSNLYQISKDLQVTMDYLESNLKKTG